MKDDTSTPTTDGSSSPNEFERDKPGTNARTDAEGAIEELRQRGGIFVEAVRATRMPMALTDPTLPGNPIVFANEAFVKLSGYRMEEVLGQQPHFMNGPGTDPRDAARFAEALRHDQDDIIETVQYRKDGSRFVATVLISGFKDPEGRILNQFMSWLDVTRRVDAEQEVADLKELQLALRESGAALVASEHRRVSALLAAEMGTWEYDLVADVCHFDVRAQELYNLPSDQLDHRPEGVASVVHPDDVVPMFEEIERATDVLGNGRYDITYRIAQGDGRYRWLRAVGITEFEGTGEARRAVRIVGASRDITLEREAEAGLRESESKYRSLFEAMDEGYLLAEVITDETSGVTDILYLEANPAAVRIAGRDFTGQRMRELDPAYEEFWYDLYGRVASTGQSARGEHFAAPHDRWFAFYVFRVGGEGSRRVASVFQDITERKREEQLLRESEERQAFLLKLSDALRPLADAAAIQSTTARLLGEYLAADRLMYAEVEGEPGSETGTIRGQYVRRDELDGPAIEPFPDHFTFADFGEHTMARRYRGEPLVVADIDSAPGFAPEERDAWRTAKVRSAVVIPLVKEGRLVAEFGVHCAMPREWPDAEVALLADVAERTWAAAERARAEQALAASEEKYRTLFESIDEGFVEMEMIMGDEGQVVDWRWVDYNPSFDRMSGLKGKKGQLFSDVVPNLEPEWAERYGHVLKTGEAVRFELPVGGLDSWFDAFVSRVGGEGSRRVAVIFNNITDRKRAEFELRKSESLLSAVLQILPVGVGVINMSGEYVILNEAMRRFLPTARMPSRDPDRSGRWSGWDKDGRRIEVHNFPGARAFRGENVVPGVEMTYTDDDGSEIWTTVAALPMKGDDGAITSVVNVVSDIDALKRGAEALRESERHANLLLAELQHRVRNTLAVVRSIARRTAENTTTAEEMLAYFQGRLDAFSRVQAALTRNPDSRIELGSLIQDELVAHAAREGEQVYIQGPTVLLEARVAERMSLAIHELTTNAVKHGALTSEGGRIRITWKKVMNGDRSELVLKWKETGVDVADRAIDREGFGMELLRRSLPYDLEAETQVALEPTGLRFELKMRLPEPATR